VIDLHNHLMPGVDDGVRDVDHARIAVAAFIDQGVRRLVVTPHLKGSLTLQPDRLGDRMERLDAAYGELRALTAEEFPELDLGRGVELRIDVPDPDLSDPRLRLAGSDAVLVEFDGFMIPVRAERVIAELAGRWIPVLAHPERYRNASVDALRPIRRAGARLQVNAGSLTGRYGAGPRTLAWALLAEGMVDAVASDFHGYDEPQSARARDAVVRRLGTEAAGLLFEGNPGRILDGEPPLGVPAVRGWLARLRRRLR
jgi:protein-tyrosine phosphatase